jgi:ribonuclease HepT-like protein
MPDYRILLGIFDKQMVTIKKLCHQIIQLDLTIEDKQFVFAIRVQQFFTALEHLFKQIAKVFENHIDNLDAYHKEILFRMNTEIPQLRPAVISQASLILLDQIRAFRHFVRHGYESEFDREKLLTLQRHIKKDYAILENDLSQFRKFVQKLLK